MPALTPATDPMHLLAPAGRRPLLQRPGERQPWAIEIKRGLAPKLERGFHLGCDVVRPARRRVVYGGTERFPIADGIDAVSLVGLCAELAAA